MEEITEIVDQPPEQKMDAAGAEAYAPENIVEFPTPTQNTPQPPQAFVTLSLDAAEVLTLYGALRTYHQALAQSDDLNQVARVVSLMQAIRPHAVDASKLMNPGAQ